VSTTEAYRVPPPPPVRLSERQRSVLELLADGLTSAEVGELLGMSPRTVKAHSDVLRRKLGVRYRRLLGAEARRRGLI
jgi:DNA-binding NarL/FixJ family response regulator